MNNFEGVSLIYILIPLILNIELYTLMLKYIDPNSGGIIFIVLFK